jgi:hypothetical protein
MPVLMFLGKFLLGFIIVVAILVLLIMLYVDWLGE